MPKPRKKGTYLIKRASFPWPQSWWEGEIFKKGAKYHVAVLVAQTKKSLFRIMKKKAEKLRLDVQWLPDQKMPSGLTPEDRANIASLQERKRQVGYYGDDSGVRSEQRAIQGQINRIKDEAARRAALGLKGSGVQPRVPLNLYVDR